MENNSIKLIDTHAHLDSDEYNNLDINIILNNALNNGVHKIISVGCDHDSSLKNIDISLKFQNIVYPTYGFHPHNANQFQNENYLFLEDLIKNSKIVAVGEIGLDYYYKFSPIEIQKKVFLKQLELAIKYNMPVIIHLRDAFDDFIKLTDTINFKGVIHCFSGDLDFTKWAVNKGFYISFTASITYYFKSFYKLANKLQVSPFELIYQKQINDEKTNKIYEIINNIPNDKIMIETDCPYMSPQDLRGKVNEPKNVVYVAKTISAIKNIDYNDFCTISTLNAQNFFNLN